MAGHGGLVEGKLTCSRLGGVEVDVLVEGQTPFRTVLCATCDRLLTEKPGTGPLGSVLVGKCAGAGDSEVSISSRNLSVNGNGAA